VMGPLGDLDVCDVCYIGGKPWIQVKTHNTNDKWLFDTGAAVTVVSEDLYSRMRPQPKLADHNFVVTGANKKPLKILGEAKLAATILNEEAEINVLVCSALSQVGILGMDSIKQMNIVMNPRTMKFFRMKDVPVQALTLQTVRLPPMSARPVKVKSAQKIEDGTMVVTNLDSNSGDKIFVPESMTNMRDNVAIVMVKNCNTHEIVIPAKTSICSLELLSDADLSINATDMEQPEDTPLPAPLHLLEADRLCQQAQDQRATGIQGSICKLVFKES